MGVPAVERRSPRGIGWNCSMQASVSVDLDVNTVRATKSSYLGQAQ